MDFMRKIQEEITKAQTYNQGLGQEFNKRNEQLNTLQRNLADLRIQIERTNAQIEKLVEIKNSMEVEIKKNTSSGKPDMEVVKKEPHKKPEK